MTELRQEWINIAIEVLDKVYAPYSYLPIGACLIAESGKIYQGINIENASLGLTNCVECTASFKAVSEGERSFTHLVVAGHTPDPIFPYGAYRQVVVKFCALDMLVTLVGDNDVMEATTVQKLLPCIFTEEDL